jgi:hypothetical protein
LLTKGTSGAIHKVYWQTGHGRKSLAERINLQINHLDKSNRDTSQEIGVTEIGRQSATDEGAGTFGLRVAVAPV